MSFLFLGREYKVDNNEEIFVRRDGGAWSRSLSFGNMSDVRNYIASNTKSHIWAYKLALELNEYYSKKTKHFAELF